VVAAQEAELIGLQEGSRSRFLTNERGLTTTYTRSATEESQTTAGVTTKTVTTGLTTIQLRQGSDDSWYELGRQTVNGAGETISSYSRGTGLVLENRTFDVLNQRQVHTRTNADGGVSTELRYPDGTLDRVTGTATRPILHEEGVQAGVNVDGLIQNVRWEKDSALDETGALTGEWTRTWTDFAGRVWKVDTANGGVSRKHYNAVGQLIKEVDADNVTTLYAYDDQGQISVTALDMDRNGVIDYGGTDRITRTTHSVTTRAGTTVQRTVTEVWATDGSPTASVVSTQDQSVDGLQSWQEQGGLTTRQYEQPVGGTWAGNWTNTAHYPDDSTLVQTYTQGRLSSTVRRDASGVLVESMTTLYDAHGRVETQTDGRGAVTTLIYETQPNPVSGGYPITADLLYQVKSPPQVAGGTIPVTTYLYDAMGRRTTTTDALNGTSIQSYTKRGEVETVTGTRQYPLSYTYTAQGRMKTMTTATGLTTWNYFPNSGLLENKQYGTQTAYSLTYTDAGRLLTKTNGRGTVITYGQNNAGQVETIDYSDATADVTFTYSRLGQAATSAQAGGSTHITNRNLYGQMTSESWAGGLLDAYSIDHPLDTLRRPAGRTIQKGSSVMMQHTQTYDEASRLKDIVIPTAFASYSSSSNQSQTATYHYETNANLVNRLEYKQGSNLAYRAQYSLNHAGAATGLHYYAGQSQTAFAGNTYTLDALNRRETATMTGGTTTTWGYNDRGEVNSESEALPGPVALPLLENGFTYDGIGNRLTATGGGRTKAYTPKVPAVFNQYGSITQPAFFPVTGMTVAGANVIVNTQAAQRAGQYFWAEVPVANVAGASFPEITVRTALPGAGANGTDLVKTSTQRPYMRPASTSLSYDDDGNLTQDARWDYTWDAENRLISMTERRDNVTAAAGDPAKRKLDFGYDAQSRRTRKTVSQWNATTSAWTTLYEHTFIWSGWHLVHEKVTSIYTFANERSYVWGIDHNGNGGYSAGTLVFYRQYHQLYDVLPNGTTISLAANVPRTRPVAHDLQGNLIGVISPESASHLDAVFDYDCFGNERQEYFQNMYQSQFNGITVSKSSCPLRFSGQYFDPETKLSYYGYRYYSAELGRWLSRDPIEEQGGENIYGMVGNDPVNRWDYLGLLGLDGPSPEPVFPPGSEAMFAELFYRFLFRLGSSNHGYSNDIWYAVKQGSDWKTYIRDIAHIADFQAKRGICSFESSLERIDVDTIVVDASGSFRFPIEGLAVGGYRLTIPKHTVFISCDGDSCLAWSKIKIEIDDVYTFPLAGHNSGLSWLNLIGQPYQIKDSSVVEWTETIYK
jgi:RHS repeat-associated protein